MEMISNPMALSIAEAKSTKIEGLRICNINGPLGAASCFTKSLTQTPFEPSSFGLEAKPNKLTLELSCEDEDLKFFNALDEWCIAYLTGHSMRLFSIQYTREEIQGIYKPCVRKSGSFDPLLRTKIIREGLNSTRYWSPDKKARVEPEVWPSVGMRVKIRIANLYITEAACGITLECTDIQVYTEYEPPSCPF
jgi:hypothetical protein